MTNNFFSTAWDWIKHCSNKTWEYLKKQFEKTYLDRKHLLIKIVIVLVCAFFVLLASFATRDAILKATKNYWDLIPGFLAINVTGNTGVSFGSLSNTNPGVVYFVQSIPIIFGLVVLIFSSNYLLDVGLSLILFGGLSNVIDRSLIDNYSTLTSLETKDAVVDYFQFSFIKNSAIFNFPDFFIICGVILLVIQVLISAIKDYKQEKRSENSEAPIKDVVLDENRNKSTSLKKRKIKVKKISIKK